MEKFVKQKWQIDQFQKRIRTLEAPVEKLRNEYDTFVLGVSAE